MGNSLCCIVMKPLSFSRSFKKPEKGLARKTFASSAALLTLNRVQLVR